MFDEGCGSAGSVYDHVVVSWGGCWVKCFNVSFQGGTFSLSVGGWGFSERGPAIGWANKCASSRANSSVGGSIGAGYGVGGSVGTNNGQVDPGDWEVDFFGGQGLSGGQYHTLWSVSL